MPCLKPAIAQLVQSGRAQLPLGYNGGNKTSGLAGEEPSYVTAALLVACPIGAVLRIPWVMRLKTKTHAAANIPGSAVTDVVRI